MREIRVVRLEPGLQLQVDFESYPSISVTSGDYRWVVALQNDRVVTAHGGAVLDTLSAQLAEKDALITKLQRVVDAAKEHYHEFVTQDEKIEWCSICDALDALDK